MYKGKRNITLIKDTHRSDKAKRFNIKNSSQMGAKMGADF
jgi:hypothetical protein